MALGWIIVCAMKTLGSYVILVGIFYQLLIQTFIFSSNIYLTINNMIITTHLIMIFLPPIVHIINFYFEFINLSWLLNSKRKPRQNLLKRYRKKFYQQKIKIRRFFPTNNQLLETTDEATCTMTTRYLKSIDTFYQIYAAILLQRNIGGKNYWHRRFWYLCWFLQQCCLFIHQSNVYN